MPSDISSARYSAELPDPRANRTKRHALPDILGVTLGAVICGADSFEGIERFAESRPDWLTKFYPPTNGVPSHDTFNRVLAALDPKAFAACLGRWVAGPCEAEFAGCDMSASVEDGHGRHEERYVTVIADPEGLPKEWEDVAAVVVAGREREVGGRNTSTHHFYRTSPRAKAEELAGHVRGHWGVENGLHWCLDVSFREDADRTRDRNAGANLGVVRRVAASLLKQDTGKGSIKARRLNAAWDLQYLERVLQGFKAN